MKRVVDSEIADFAQRCSTDELDKLRTDRDEKLLNGVTPMKFKDFAFERMYRVADSEKADFAQRCSTDELRYFRTDRNEKLLNGVQPMN